MRTLVYIAGIGPSIITKNESFAIDTPTHLSAVGYVDVPGHMDDPLPEHRIFGVTGHVGAYACLRYDGEPGYVGALITTAILVDSWEEAKSIAGFVPLFETDCSTFYDLNILPRMSGEVPAPVFFFPRPENVHIPRYKDGVAEVSLLPVGEIGYYVFLETHPNTIFFTRSCESMADRVRKIQNFAKDL